jgi:hypothetical protein
MVPSSIVCRPVLSQYTTAERCGGVDLLPSWQSGSRKTEGPGQDTAYGHSTSDQLASFTPYLLKFPAPPKIVALGRDRAFKKCACAGHFIFKPYI